MTEETYLEKLIAVERTIGRIYLRFAERFSDVPGSNSFWKKMADEEENHASMLSHLSDESFHDLPSGREGEDPFYADVTLRELRRILVGMKRDTVTLEAAISLAFGIEYSLAEKHVLVKASVPLRSWKEVLDQLVLADKKHIQKLRTFAGKHNVFLPDDV